MIQGIPKEVKNQEILLEIQNGFVQARGIIYAGEEELYVKFNRPKKNLHSYFVLSSISTKTGNVLWDFNPEKLTRNNGARLFYLNGEFIIGITCRKKLFKIISVNSLITDSPLQQQEHLAELKIQLAKQESLLIWQNDAEWEKIKQERQLTNEHCSPSLSYKPSIPKEGNNGNGNNGGNNSNTEVTQKPITHSQTEPETTPTSYPLSSLERKKLRREALRKRPKIRAWDNKTGFTVGGIPVTEKEWQSLPNGVYAILVSEYNPETGEIGFPLSAFKVKKSGGGKCKKNFFIKADLTLEYPITKKGRKYS